MIRLEITDKEINPRAIIVTIKNWSDNYSAADLDEWVAVTYGPGWKRKTLIPPRRPVRSPFGMSRPVRRYQISVTIKKV
jgi:hypothetical protein